MTSGNFQSFPVASIVVNRGERQRKELRNIEELAESINRTGLINPIVVTREGVLVAGERRYTAIRSLGWTAVPVQFAEDLSELELHVIELEENIKREDLTWQEECDAIRAYHEVRRASEAEWSQASTAAALGISAAEISRRLLVADAVAAGNVRVAEADRFSTAFGVASRELERRKSSASHKIANLLPEVKTEESGEVTVTEAGPAQRAVPLIHADFHEWAAAYTGPRFNMIHCDFPYGVGMHNSDQGAGASHGTYEDSPDVYWKLLETLKMAMSNVVADSAHLMFWFSMDYYEETKILLEDMGWRVSPFPLVWVKSDNTGIIPDAKRGPRRVYETAFFASRGDRLLATGPHGQGPVANATMAPGREKTVHMNEKPVSMLRHFMRLCVDEYSTVLDPTCGSANALKAAQLLGAPTVLGLERDAEFFDLAKTHYFEALE
jgi:ParB/RepB/Spo0J family partition protein